MDIERIGEAHEHVEQRTVIDGLRDLRIAPPDIAQALHVIVRNAISVTSQCTNELEQEPLRRGDDCLVEVAIPQRLSRAAELLSLQLQEPRMGAQSIVAAADRRHVGSDHFMLSARERSIAEMKLRCS